MIAVDILREEMEKANGYLTVWQEHWIVKAMERYAEQKLKNRSLPDNVGRREQLTCQCVGLGSTECYKINNEWICSKCNRPLANVSASE